MAVSRPIRKSAMQRPVMRTPSLDPDIKYSSPVFTVFRAMSAFSVAVSPNPRSFSLEALLSGSYVEDMTTKAWISDTESNASLSNWMRTIKVEDRSWEVEVHS
jgi:hypothetical protein